jgi:hypothetical protein
MKICANPSVRNNFHLINKQTAEVIVSLLKFMLVWVFTFNFDIIYLLSHDVRLSSIAGICLLLSKRVKR